MFHSSLPWQLEWSQSELGLGREVAKLGTEQHAIGLRIRTGGGSLLYFPDDSETFVIFLMKKPTSLIIGACC